MIQKKQQRPMNFNKKKAQKKQCQKQKTTDMLYQNLNKFDKAYRIPFLCGYLCSTIHIKPTFENITRLQTSITNLTNQIQSKAISQLNLIEILVESFTEINKKYLFNDNGLTKFQQRVIENYMKVSQCRRYLREKWYKQANSKIEQQQVELVKVEKISYHNYYSQQNIQNQQQSLLLIKKLEQEQKQELKKLKIKQMQEQNRIKQMLKQQEQQRAKQLDKIQNQIPTCQICLQEIPFEEMGALQCGHIYHKKCIREHIEALVNVKKIQIPCPSACGSNLPIQDIAQFIDGDLMQKYNKFCFDVYVQKHGKQISWCPTPGCTAVFAFDQELHNYHCLVCRKHYCLKCRCIYHDGMTCAEYKINNSYGEDDRKFQQFVRGAKFKQCPKCLFWVQRNQGCSTMRCRCGHQFCYDCGGSDCPHGACKNIGRAPIIYPNPNPRRRQRGLISNIINKIKR